MDTELTPTQWPSNFCAATHRNPAQYLKKFKLLELEFADLMALSSGAERRDRSAWRLGIH
jgi:hypothetical protein